MTIDFDKVEERAPEFAQLNAKGNGVGAIMNMQTQFHLSEAGSGDARWRWEADVKIAGPVGRDGPARPAADRQPAGRQRSRRAREAGQRGCRRVTASSSTRLSRRCGGPFRIGVMQLTMEPLDEMLESARVMDEAGMDTIWLAEAYPWWRKHGMEARSSTVVSALMARETERLTIGWGIISPFTRHPVQVAMDARVVQEAAGRDGSSSASGRRRSSSTTPQMQTKKTLGPMRDAVDDRARRARRRRRSSTTGDTWSASTCRRCSAEAHTPRDVPPGLRRGDGAEDAGARRQRSPTAA